MNERILYMGTPYFSACLLEYLINEGFNIIGLVSQPDKYTGRNKVLTETETKKVALKYNIPVYQKELIKNDYDFINDLNVDLILTCAYGQFLPSKLLAIPKYGCLNVHASLLPKYRGGAPIQRAIMNGDKETGVCLMEMTSKMDAGRVFDFKKVSIDEDDNLSSVIEKLIEVSKSLVKDNLEKYFRNELVGVPQDEEQVTFAYNISREEEKIDFSKSSIEIFNLIRALDPSPNAYAFLQNQPIKIISSKIFSEDYKGEPGKISIIDKKLIVDCGLGQLEILSLQPSGKKIMDSKSYLNGMQNKLQGLKFE